MDSNKEMARESIIELNNEKRALKYAYKKLTSKISEKILKAKREFDSSDSLSILLGKKYCALLVQSVTNPFNGIEVDLDNYSVFDNKISELKLWGFLIHMSKKDDYTIEIIASLGSIDFSTPGGIDMNELINDLPDNLRMK